MPKLYLYEKHLKIEPYVGPIQTFDVPIFTEMNNFVNDIIVRFCFVKTKIFEYHRNKFKNEKSNRNRKEYPKSRESCPIYFFEKDGFSFLIDIFIFAGHCLYNLSLLCCVHLLGIFF